MTAEPTPAKVLTKSQMKRAARDSKVRTRNVLFNPFRLEWPTVPKPAAAAVLAAIDAHMEQFDIPSGVPQEEYTRLLAAGDRAAITARRQEVRAAAAPLLAARRAHLADCVLGFNAASRALEAGRLAALLVETDTPALETRFLLPLAAGRRCPAACLPRLRPALQRRLGLHTAVFGMMRETATEGHRLRPLYDAVCAAAAPLLPRRAAAPAAAVAAGADGGAGDDAQQAEKEEMEVTDQSAVDADNAAGDVEQTPPSAANAEPLAAPTPAAPAAPPSPVPFEQSDFISLSAPPPTKRRAPTDAPLDGLISIDTEGVPHKKRLQLKEARVMKVTLGNKALKKAARAAKKKGGPKEG